MQRSYVIIGVDPGKMTGIKVYAPLEGILGHDQVRQEDIARYLHALINQWARRLGGDSVHIAVEKFIITRRTAQLSQESDALEITGMVKGFAATAAGGTGITVHQLLKANLKFANDDMLREVGWYVPGKRHSNDAARQVFALLKQLDYPRWSKLVTDARLKAQDERTNDVTDSR